MLTREYDGLAGAGGVKDVCKQLSHALARAGIKITVVMPRYGMMDKEKLGLKPTSYAFTVGMNYAREERRERVDIWKLTQGKVRILLVEADRYTEKKSVYTYTAEEEARNPSHKQGTGHYDYFAMNVLLQKAAMELSTYMGEKPDVFHCQDGHTAILPAMIREIDGYRPYYIQSGAVTTVHNAGIGYHQEVADLPFAHAITGLPMRVINDSLLDGAFDPFIAGAQYGVINTVSENYARELRETDADRLTGRLGHTLLSRGIILEGITNGIDPADYDPTEPGKLGLAAAFNPETGGVEGKEKCKMDLLTSIRDGKFARVKVAGEVKYRTGVPLLTMVGRLMRQKGVDVLVQALDTLLATDREFQVVILGSGSRDIEDMLTKMAEKPENKGRMAILIGYDPLLANKIYAGGDFFVIPSQYEPCGLTDFMAQLLGNLPIVHFTGGLVKVTDNETGFGYVEHSPDALIEAVERAFAVYRNNPEKLRAIQKKALETIKEKYTWDRVLERYLQLYKKSKNNRDLKKALGLNVS